MALKITFSIGTNIEGLMLDDELVQGIFGNVPEEQIIETALTWMKQDVQRRTRENIFNPQADDYLEEHMQRLS